MVHTGCDAAEFPVSVGRNKIQHTNAVSTYVFGGVVNNGVLLEPANRDKMAAASWRTCVRAETKVATI